MKKSFTLLEVVISISIFSILLLFIYKVLNETNLTNHKFEQHIKNESDNNQLYTIVTEDFLESIGKITIDKDQYNNSIVTFSSNNTYNNSFYTHITYIVSNEKNLLRVESKTPFSKKNLNNSFLQNSYIDIIASKVESFKLYKQENKYMFYIYNEDKSRITFPVFKSRI